MTMKFETYKINSYVTYSLIRKLNPGGHLVFMSSTELYSGLLNVPFSENQVGTTTPAHPRACYIEGKRAGEMFVNWSFNEGIKASSVRLSYTYGPGTKSNDQRVINVLIRDALQHRSVKLRDAGTALRTNLYSRDAAFMILKILCSPMRPLYNVSGTEITSIYELGSLIASLTDSTLEVGTDNDFNVFGQIRAEIDRGAYIEDFGAADLTSLRQGLEKTIHWQRSYLFG